MSKFLVGHMLNLTAVFLGVAIVLGAFTPYGQTAVWSAIAVQWTALCAGVFLFWRAFREL
jgi:hypothetical protein